MHVPFPLQCSDVIANKNMQKGGGNEGEQNFPKYFKVFSEIVGTPWHFWGTLRRQPNTDFKCMSKYYWFLLQEKTLFQAIPNKGRIKASIW